MTKETDDAISLVVQHFLLDEAQPLADVTDPLAAIGEGEPFDANYGVEDIAPETLSKMTEDCRQFQLDNYFIFDELSLDDEMRAGHDFWLTRNHHGAGFWDGDWRKSIADKLTEYSHKMGECNLILGDDGLIYGG